MNVGREVNRLRAKGPVILIAQAIGLGVLSRRALAPVLEAHDLRTAFSLANGCVPEYKWLRSLPFGQLGKPGLAPAGLRAVYKGGLQEALSRRALAPVLEAHDLRTAFSLANGCVPEYKWLRSLPFGQLGKPGLAPAGLRAVYKGGLQEALSRRALAPVLEAHDLRTAFSLANGCVPEYKWLRSLPFGQLGKPGLAPAGLRAVYKGGLQEALSRRALAPVLEAHDLRTAFSLANGCVPEYKWLRSLPFGQLGKPGLAPAGLRAVYKGGLQEALSRRALALVLEAHDLRTAFSLANGCVPEYKWLRSLPFGQSGKPGLAPAGLRAVYKGGLQEAPRPMAGRWPGLLKRPGLWP